MFNLQQKYKKKKSFHKMQKQETSSLESPLFYQGRNMRGTARNRQVIWADGTQKKVGLFLQPAALGPCPPCRGAPFGLGRQGTFR